MTTRLTVPDDVSFADLCLARAAKGLSFAWAPLVAICRANGLDPDATLAEDDNVAEIIAAWYVAHRAAGGDADQIAEDLAHEVLIEGRRGSHQGGRA